MNNNYEFFELNNCLGKTTSAVDYNKYSKYYRLGNYNAKTTEKLRCCSTRRTKRKGK